jgi:hypothetical protein
MHRPEIGHGDGDVQAAPGSPPPSPRCSISDYRRLWWAGTFSFLAVQMEFLLRGVLAWDLTEREGSARASSISASAMAMLISTPLGGVAADRLPKRQAC